MTTTVGTSGYINSVTKMDKTTAADGTLFDAIHQQLLNNDAFLNSEIMGMIQKAVNSGLISMGTLHTPGSGDTFSSWINKFIVNGPLNQAIVNGTLVNTTGDCPSGSFLYSNDGRLVVGLDAPPTANVTPSLPMSARDDLVFLEMWLDATTGAPKWRIRVVDGVDFGTYTEGFVRQGNAWGGPTGQGALSSPITYASGQPSERYYFHQSGVSSTDPTATDAGLYVAGKGDSASQSQFNTLDGYVYAIPLFRVRRRNNAGFDPDNNPMGARDYYTCTVATAVPTTNAGSTATITLTSIPSSMQVNDYIQFGPLSAGGLILQVTAINTGTNAITATFLSTSNIGTSAQFGLVPQSSRPDGLYSNIIDATDIVDLRHQVSLTGFNMQALLEKNTDLLLRGLLTTNQQVRYGRDYIGLNTGSYTDDANTLLYLKFDGSMAGTANGAVVANTKFGSGTETYKNGVQGLAGDFSSANYGEYYTVTIPVTNWTVEGFFKQNFVGNAPATEYVLEAYTTDTQVANRTLLVWCTTNGINFGYYTSGSLNTLTTISMVNCKLGDTHYFKFSYDGSVFTVQFDENVTTYSRTVTLTTATHICIGGDITSASNYFNGQLDLIRVSNIVRTGTPLPTGFSYANGDRILDGPNADFSTWSDDVGGTAGTGGRTNPYGLSRVPNQIAARVAYNGQDIRHYYGQGITPGWALSSTNTNTAHGTQPNGSFDSSGESITVFANEAADGIRTNFTFTKPSNAVGLYTHNAQNFNYDFNVALSSAQVDSSGNLTVTTTTAPSSKPYLSYTTGQRHAHFIPSTKGFVIHDWTDDQASGTGSQTVFQTTKYNVTSVNHVRVGGTIQNGGYSTNGLNAQSTLTAGAAQNATTITVASASNFVANQNIRIANGDGTWYTTTITSISGNTLTVPVLTKALTQNATVQGAALVTFTTAPVAGTNNIDIVYESVLTPQLGDYLRVMYQATPYQGLLGTPNAGSGKYQFLFVDEDAGFITTIGSGSTSTPSVPAWMKDYPVPSSQLPINGYDYQLKHDTISLSNNTVTGISQQFLDNEQIYEVNASNAANIYSPLAVATPSTQANRGYSTSAVNDGASRQLVVALRDLSSAVPHLVGVALLAQDTSTGELLLLVATMLRTDATNKLQIDGTNGAAIDVFKVQGRPLTKAYGGVAA